MIGNFRDHAANERTFLAWVRTSIAVMAFGFIVEKFDLFLEIGAPSLASRLPPVPDRQWGNIIGLVLVVLGTVMIILSAIRFMRTARKIDSRKEKPEVESYLDLILAALLVLLGIALFLYLTHAFTRVIS